MRAATVQKAHLRKNVSDIRRESCELMYIHLGHVTLTALKDIVGIFDMDTATVQKATRNFLRQGEINHEIINVSNELPKTFVVCERKGVKKTYISPVAVGTLEKRLNRKL